MQSSWRLRALSCSSRVCPRSSRRPLCHAIIASLFATGAAAQDDTDSLFVPRLTIEAPLATRHVPHDEGFDDHNWGAFIDVDAVKHFGVIGGYFINSYRRETAFAGIAYTPFYIKLTHAEIDAFAAIAADLNGGYKWYNRLDPLLGAVSVRVTATNFDYTPLQLLNNLGVAVTFMPPVSCPVTAINLSVTYTLPLR